MNESICAEARQHVFLFAEKHRFMQRVLFRKATNNQPFVQTEQNELISLSFNGTSQVRGSLLYGLGTANEGWYDKIMDGCICIKADSSS